MRALLGIGLAHAVAFSLVAHCHYVVAPPTRQSWFVAEFALALAAWPFAAWYVRRVLWPAYSRLPSSERRTFITLSITLGLVVSQWWAGSLADTFWLHAAWLRGVLALALEASHTLVLSAVYAGLVVATVAVNRVHAPAAGDSPTTERRVCPLAVVAGFALVLLAANAFTVWYVGQERALYYWDYMTYWTKTGELADTLRTASPGEVWDTLRFATQRDDYGPLPALGPATVVALFGDSRLVYLLAVVNLYLTALALAAWLFTRRFCPSAGVLVPLLAVLLSPVAWQPILRGYLDIGGAARGTFALLVYLSRPAGELSGPRIVLLAALLAAMALFRRWYSFFVVAFALTASLDTLIAAYRAGWADLSRRLAQLALIGGWSAVLVLSLAAGWVIRAATTNYAEAYVAYKTPVPWLERVITVLDSIGLAYLVGALLGGIVLLRFRDTRRPALFLMSMCPIILLHFMRVQDFGIHHYYLFLPSCVILQSLGFARLLQVIPGWIKWPTLAAATGAGVVMMAVLFVPAAWPLRAPLRPAVSALYAPPLTRDDLPELRRLLRYTESLAARTGNGRVAVVSSSLTLNGTMFATADRSLREPLIRSDRVLYGYAVDRVSGFPSLFIQADVLVVGTPPQTHLRVAEQQGIVITAESLLQRRDIGTAFESLPQVFHLRDGVTAKVYRRVGSISQLDFAAYCERLRHAHPDCPVFFTPPPGILPDLRSPADRL
jgi:hypothetical protein